MVNLIFTNHALWGLGVVRKRQVVGGLPTEKHIVWTSESPCDIKAKSMKWRLTGHRLHIRISSHPLRPFDTN